MPHARFYIRDVEVQMRHLLLLIQCRGPDGRGVIIHLLKGDPSRKPFLLQVDQDGVLLALEPGPAQQLFVKRGQLIRMVGIQDRIPPYKVKRHKI